MYEVLKDVGLIGGIIAAAIAVVIFIVQKIPEVIRYYRNVSGRLIAVPGGAKSGSPRGDKNRKKGADADDTETVPLLKQEGTDLLNAVTQTTLISEEEPEGATAVLKDKDAAEAYAASIADASYTVVLTDSEEDGDATQVLNE